MVKRTSSLASNEKFQVRFLVELLEQAGGVRLEAVGRQLQASRSRNDRIKPLRTLQVSVARDDHSFRAQSG